ncbi:hypothetical protein I4641_01375 [Waterburya agarophytonicola K14]|uniref:Uncharacterized protein n=1 Tax=Waterburya agarophytonicola KI4 TaxID=2874699 RepID=A0A964FDI9_9CYAN|nr:hypothetical protein [Waterburya agarophytonicola]MCC0175630.1 hypothetical protein [Waterburya agarophytonicola KI4]
MLNSASKHKQLKQLKESKLGIEIILSFIAITLVIAIFFKAIIDLDNNYDPGWYHLPFAGRLGGILPREMFIGDEKWFEPRFDGFPLLAHFLQGIFWRITRRIQSTNLVSFFSVIGYLFFLRSYFKVPLYLSAIALFSIPLVLTHATTSFVDLFGNIGTSILVMMTYSFYKNRQLPNIKELAIAFVGAAIAANTKTQLQPLVFVILIVAGIRLGWLYFQQKPTVKLTKVIPIALVASIIIFATPVKNTVLYQNPLYPIKIQIGGIVLNHKLSPEAYEGGNRQINWVKSVLEINAPLFWTPDQWSGDIDRSRKGGFWGVYVVFNLLLLIGLALREAIVNNSSKNSTAREAKAALFTAIAMSIIPLNFPQSHELRYFMYWMICLVSLNLYLISLPKNKEFIGRWLQPKYVGLLYTIFLTIILIKVGKFYAKPSFITLDKHLAFGVKSEFVNQIKPNEQVCLLSKHIGEDTQTAPIAALKYAFLYSSYFHPELDYDYSIRAALNSEVCGDRTIIPSNL